jgi:hypothetical protein
MEVLDPRVFKDQQDQEVQQEVLDLKVSKETLETLAQQDQLV